MSILLNRHDTQDKVPRGKTHKGFIRVRVWGHPTTILGSVFYPGEVSLNDSKKVTVTTIVRVGRVGVGSRSGAEYTPVVGDACNRLERLVLFG